MILVSDETGEMRTHFLPNHTHFMDRRKQNRHDPPFRLLAHLCFAIGAFSVWKCRRKRQKIERLFHQLFRFLQRQPHTGIEFCFPVSPIGLPNMPASIR